MQLAKPLAVGRICDDAAIRSAPVEARRVGDFKMHDVVHLGKRGIVPCDLDRLRVDVAAPDLVFAVKFLVHGLLRRIRPDVSVEIAPPLRGKAAVKARRAVFGDQRRLNGDGARAAERVAKRVAPAIARKLHHRGSKRLTQRRGNAHGAVAALVKSLAGGVEAQHDLIFHDRKLHLIALAVLGKRLHPVPLAKADGYGLFHDRLTRGNGVERRVYGVAFDGKLTAHGDIILPRNGLRALKELFKRRRAEGREHQQHARAAAKVHVQPRDIGLTAAAENASVFYLHIGKSEPLHLVADELFKPQKTGDRKCQHTVPSFTAGRFLHR